VRNAFSPTPAPHVPAASAQRRQASALAPYGDEPEILAIAHRGGSALGPENTLEAFERSVALGYRYLETDVRVTADGVCVAFHDRDLTRVTGARRRLDDLTWAEVQQLRVHGVALIPRVRDLLAAWPQVRWVLDVKQPAALGALTAVVLAAGAENRVCLSGTWDGPMAQARRALGPSARTAIGWASLGRLLAGGSVPPGGAEFVHLPLRFGGRRLPTRRLVDHARAQGLRVVVWGVDTASEADRLLDDGVDGVITDHPDMLREVLAARGAWATSEPSSTRYRSAT